MSLQNIIENIYFLMSFLLSRCMNDFCINIFYCHFNFFSFYCYFYFLLPFLLFYLFNDFCVSIFYCYFYVSFNFSFV